MNSRPQPSPLLSIPRAIGAALALGLLGFGACPGLSTPTPTPLHTTCDLLFDQAAQAADDLIADLEATYASCDGSSTCKDFKIITLCGDFGYTALTADAYDAVQAGQEEINTLYCETYLDEGCEAHHTTGTMAQPDCHDGTCDWAW